AVAIAVLAGSLLLPQESIASLLTGMPGIFGTIPQRPFLFVMLLTLPLSAIWFLAWRKRAGEVSVRPGLFILPVLFLLMTCGASVIGFQKGGGFERIFGAGLFEGNQTVRITQQSEHFSP
ncbi:MAG: hypothetical protein JXX14_23225, partial [Deltaproteobacteria bacterium]|nr:hypothetical protein [Deltaproteobacteria bacterium]